MGFITTILKPLAYISLPAFILHRASVAHPLARYYVRLGLYIGAIAACSAWGVLVSIGASLVGRRYDTNWVIARTFYGLTSRLLGIYIDVEGLEHLRRRPAVLLGNHQSMLDILYIGRIFPRQISITAKKELQWIPFLGQFMTLSGAVFIDRKNNASALQSVADAGQTMKDRNIDLWIFPEGTRTNKEGLDMRPFKKGAFHLAVQSGVPIIPVVCQHYWHLYHSGTLESGKLKVKILPPVPTAGLTAADVNDLAVKVHAQMLDALYELSGVKREAPHEEIIAKLEKEGPPPVEEAPEPSSAEQGRPRIADLPRDVTPTVSRSEPLVVDTSAPPPNTRTGSGSETGPETEEDEGMVLVDRPVTPAGVRS